MTRAIDTTVAAGAALVGVLLIAVGAGAAGEVHIGTLMGEPTTALIVFLSAALLIAAFMLRPLWHPTGMPFAPRVVICMYFLLLCLGVAAVAALRILALKGYPIASQQRLPTVPQTTHALYMALLGGVSLFGGWAGVHLLLRQRTPLEPCASAEFETVWAGYLKRVPWLFGIGLLGCALITASTKQIPILSHDIDTLRFQQSSGLGFASLFEYELMLAACLGAVGTVVDIPRRRIWVLVIVGALVALLIFRVERTPFIVTFFTFAFTRVAVRRRTSPVVVGALAFLVVALVAGLGLVRFASAGSLSDKREALTRPLFDAAPEFREQAFVYRIYPELRGYTAHRDLAAIGSSVLPGKLLRLVGVDKSALYSDVSRDYADTMKQLGYYPYNDRALRVGLVGEAYADFGTTGIIVVLSLFGGGVALLGLWSRPSPDRLLLSVVTGVFATMLLITPPPALLPIALIVIGTPVVFHRTHEGRSLLRRRRPTAPAPTTIVVRA